MWPSRGRVYGNPLLHAALQGFLSSPRFDRLFECPHVGSGTHLENAERLPVADPLGAPAIDGEHPVPLLDAAVPVRQAASYHLVHLEKICQFRHFL